MALENWIVFSCHHEQKSSLGNAQNTVKLDGDADNLEDTSFCKTEFTASVWLNSSRSSSLPFKFNIFEKPKLLLV